MVHPAHERRLTADPDAGEGMRDQVRGYRTAPGGHALQQRLGRRQVADPPERAGGHHPYVRIGVPEQLDERRYGVPAAEDAEQIGCPGAADRIGPAQFAAGPPGGTPALEHDDEGRACLAAYLVQQGDRVRVDRQPHVVGQPDQVVDRVRVVVAGRDGQQQPARGRGECGPALRTPAPGGPAGDDGGAERHRRDAEHVDRRGGGIGKRHARCRANTASTRVTSSRGLNGLTM